MGNKRYMESHDCPANIDSCPAKIDSCPAKIDRMSFMRRAGVSYYAASSVRDIDSVGVTTARRVYISVGSTPASIRVRTESRSSTLTGQQ